MKALRIILLLCLVWVTASCVELLDHNELESNALKLTLRFYIPSGQDPGTKTTVPASVTEKTIYDLQVWAFDHDYPRDTTALAYAKVSQIQQADGWVDRNVYEMTLSFPYYLVTRERLIVDFYVLGNAGSIGIGDESKARRSRLSGLGFGKGETTSVDPFGPNAPVLALEAGKGLPFSGFFDGNGQGYNISFLRDSTTWKNTWEQNLDSIPLMQLQRAVSKINFVFSQPPGLNARIDRIVLDGNQIPDSTYVFPQTNVWKEQHYGGQTVLIGDNNTPLLSSIGSIANPATLKDQDFVTLQTAAANGQASITQAYLRESDKTTMTGTIHYTVNGTSTSKPFSLNRDDFTFRRNHCWTVYAYFQGSSLFTQIAPWDGWLVVIDPSYIE